MAKVPNTSIYKPYLKVYNMPIMRAVVWEADVIAGADELLPILKRLGVKVGVLASGERAAELDEAPYRAYIDALVISETNSIDPAKRGLVDILERLHVAPEQAVMVSDRVFDIMGGKEGRLAKTVGVRVFRCLS